MRSYRAQPRRLGFTTVELLVVIALIITLIGLLVVAVQRVRVASARTQSTNNLRQIALAFQNFHDAAKRLPYNGTSMSYQAEGGSCGGPASAGNHGTGSWAFMILPYLDQEPMFDTRSTGAGVAVFMCPARGRPISCTGRGGPGAWTDYFLNSFLNDPNGEPDARDNRRRLSGIIDGASNTIVAGHGQLDPLDYSSINTRPGFTDVIFNGGSAGLCRPNMTIVLGRDSSQPASVAGNWGGPFQQGALMALADGTVRMFPYTMSGGVIDHGICGAAPNCGANGTPSSNLFGDFLTPAGGELTQDL